MQTLVGTFAVEDYFYITGRGLMLLGKANGYLAVGYQLIFSDATCWTVKGVEHNRQDKLAVLVDASFATREELLRRGIVWNFAQILAP